MKLVILSSGMSSRLAPLTDNMHKCLLPINGKTLIEHQLDAITSFPQIDEIVIVIGFKGEMIREKIGSEYRGTNISFIYNDCYDTKNISYTLSLIKNKIEHQDYIYMEGDVLFHPEILNKIISSCSENCFIVDPDCKSKNVDTIITGSKGIVQSLLIKEHGDLSAEINDIDNFVGELIMLSKFGSSFGSDLMSKLLTNGFGGDEPHLYSVINELLPIHKTAYTSAEGLPWIEIDNFQDYDQAKTTCTEIQSCIWNDTLKRRG